LNKKKCSIVWPEGIKKTKQRKCVLSVLEDAELPVTALDIFNQLERCGVSLSTVYRILETFIEKGLVTQTAVMAGGMALYELKRHEHRHYAFCMECHKMIVIDNCPMEVFTPELRESNFHVLGHKLEIYGYCDECYTKLA
jgi:Fur family ferric uptake transcriptional regulator